MDIKVSQNFEMVIIAIFIIIIMYILVIAEKIEEYESKSNRY